MKKSKSLQPEFIFKVCLISLIISLLFIFMNFMFLFTVEDSFLERGLQQEKERLTAYYQQHSRWPVPDQPHMQIYTKGQTLPDGIGGILAQEPRRREFYGRDGRHYHLMPLPEGAWLVSEVSSQLLIRPMRKGLIIVYGIMALMAAVAGCFMAYRMARKTIQPLTALADHISALNPQEKTQPFSANYPNNEIGVLARQLEQSLQRIDAFIEREQQFSRDVSHDLRTPLAVASGAVEILRQAKGAGHTVDQTVLLDRIESAHSHMSLTISALLSMAREQNNILPAPQKLLPVIEKIILQHSDQLDAQQISVDIQVPYQSEVIVADGVLEILLANILGNAFHYTEGGLVTISFDQGRLTITDTAGGIPADLQDKIFEKYTRSDHSSGYGLGLSIVKRLCEYHGIDLVIDHLKGGTAITLGFSPA